MFFLFLDLTDGGAEVVDVIGIRGVEALEFLKTRVVFFVVDGLDVECWGWFGWSDISGLMLFRCLFPHLFEMWGTQILVGLRNRRSFDSLPPVGVNFAQDDIISGRGR